jgi:nucleoside phosphorylase
MIETHQTNFADLCVVTAVDVEFKIASQLLAERSLYRESGMKICRGRCGNRRVTIIQSKMGAGDFEEWLADHLAHNSYDGLIVAGLAGGLDPKLRVGDAVLYDLCYDAREDDRRSDCGEFVSIACDVELSGFVFEAALCLRGSGITVSRILTEANNKLSLGDRLHAAAVDMETYVVLSVCSRFGVPAAALRVISDEAGCNLPDFNRAYEADGQMNRWRMAGAMMARPLATMRFLLNIGQVLRSLRENLSLVLAA